MSEKIDNENSEPRKIISDGISILGGIYFDGGIFLEEESDPEKKIIPSDETLKVPGSLDIDKRKEET